MLVMKHRLLVLLGFGLSLIAATYGPPKTAPAVRQAHRGPAADSMLSFREDIFPIIQAKCNADPCHGRRGGLQLTAYAPIRLNLEVIVERIESERNPMPPYSAREKLTAEEKQAILRWAEEGGQLN
jgi:hypothetical protein